MWYGGVQSDMTVTSSSVSAEVLPALEQQTRPVNVNATRDHPAAIIGNLEHTRNLV